MTTATVAIIAQAKRPISRHLCGGVWVLDRSMCWPVRRAYSPSTHFVVARSSSETIIRHSSRISHSRLCLRKLSTSPYLSTAASKAKPPPTHDRGPPSKEDTQTDFGALNILGNTPSPATSID